MPETAWTIRWPDGAQERCYSPSRVVADVFTPGTAYPLTEFLARARMAMQRASDRVEARYGVPCSLARAELARIERRAAAFAHAPGAAVTCVAIER